MLPNESFNENRPSQIHHVSTYPFSLATVRLDGCERARASRAPSWADCDATMFFYDVATIILAVCEEGVQVKQPWV